MPALDFIPDSESDTKLDFVPDSEPSQSLDFVPDAPETPSLRADIPAPGQAQVVPQRTIPSGLQAFPVAEQRTEEIQAAPELSKEQIQSALEEVSNAGVKFPRPDAEKHPIIRGIADPILGTAEFMLSGKGLAVADAMAVPGLGPFIAGPMIAGMVKGAAEDFGTASVTGDKETTARAATTLALLALPAMTKEGRSHIREQIEKSAEGITAIPEAAKAVNEAGVPATVKALMPRTAAAVESEPGTLPKEVLSATSEGKIETGVPPERLGTDTGILSEVTGPRDSLQPTAPVQEAPKEAPALATTEEIQLRPSSEFDLISGEQAANNPELVGMGGAVPGEFKPATTTATGIKNAAVDAQRLERGLEPIPPPETLTDKQVHAETMAKIDMDPAWQDRLIAELSDKPRAMTPHETVAMLQRETDLRNEYAKTTRDLAQAYDDGRMADIPELQARASMWSDKMSEIEKITGRGGAGTESGRSLRWRRTLMKEDYSLAQMELSKRADLGGRPLTSDDRVQLVKAQQEIERTQKAYDEYVAKSDQRIAELEAARVMAELKAQAAKEPTVPAHITKIVQRIGDVLHKRGDAARARLRGKTFTLSPEVLKDLIEVGADNIYTIGVDLAKWSTKMVEDIGEHVRPYLQQIWEASQKHINETVDRIAAPKVREPVKRAASKVDVAAQREDLKGKIAERVSAGEASDIAGLVQKLARGFVEQGINTRDELIDAVHGVLKEIVPDISRRGAMDAISGYGRFKQLTKDEISVQLRDLKGQMQQVGKIEDIEAKKPPLKTGVERRVPTDEERRLIKQVNEAKRKHGVVVTDPETQLKSVLESRKTYYRNQISDLESQIKSREKFVKQKTPSPTDPELEYLKARRNELKTEFDNIFQKPGLTDEQRIRLAMAGIERSIADLEARIKNKDIAAPREKAKGPTTPALEAARARRDALREELNELHDADAGVKAARAAAELAKVEARSAELEAKINAGDIAAKTSKPAISTPELDRARAERDQLNKIIVKLRAAEKGKTLGEIEASKIEKLQVRADELARQINTGEIEAAKRSGVPVSPEIQALRDEIAQLNKIKSQLRNAAKPKKTPEEIALQSLKTRLANRTAELLEKTANGDFTTKPRRSITLDQEALRLRAENTKAKQDWERARMKDKLSKRSVSERVQDTLVKWRRSFILSSPITLAKLTSAAIQRMVFTPLEEGIGAVLSKVPGISSVAKQAPREGGLSVKAEAKAITDAVVKGMADSWQTVRKGKSYLETVYGKDAMQPRSWLDLFGEIHGALKAPTKRGEFARSFQKRIEWNIRRGVDVTDPVVQARIAFEAYKDANRSIFLQDNRVVTAYKRGIQALKQPDKATGKTPIGSKALATTAEILLPIVKVPTNIVAETMQYAVGSVTGSVRLANALRKGVADLPPEHADLIMRELKKGSLGAAVMLLGFLNAESIGGYYQPGEKRKPGELKPTEIRTPIGDVPSYLLHNPLLETLQIGATIRRVADSKLRKKDTDTQGLGVGATAAALGLAEEIPFVREMFEIHKAFNPHERGAFIGELTKSITIPQLVQWMARYTDKDITGETVKRKPEGIIQHIETGIPGLRSSVPVKEEKKPTVARITRTRPERPRRTR